MTCAGRPQGEEMGPEMDWGLLLGGLYRDNGKENGNYYGLYRVI